MKSIHRRRLSFESGAWGGDGGLRSHAKCSDDFISVQSDARVCAVSTRIITFVDHNSDQSCAKPRWDGVGEMDPLLGADYESPAN